MHMCSVWTCTKNNHVRNMPCHIKSRVRAYTSHASTWACLLYVLTRLRTHESTSNHHVTLLCRIFVDLVSFVSWLHYIVALLVTDYWKLKLASFLSDQITNMRTKKLVFICCFFNFFRFVSCPFLYIIIVVIVLFLYNIYVGRCSFFIYKMSLATLRLCQ